MAETLSLSGGMFLLQSIFCLSLVADAFSDGVGEEGVFGAPSVPSRRARLGRRT